MNPISYYGIIVSLLFIAIGLQRIATALEKRYIEPPPDHPNCRCYVSPPDERTEDFGAYSEGEGEGTRIKMRSGKPEQKP
jgi:hypothetical protein